MLNSQMLCLILMKKMIVNNDTDNKNNTEDL